MNGVRLQCRSSVHTLQRCLNDVESQYIQVVNPLRVRYGNVEQKIWYFQCTVSISAKIRPFGLICHPWWTVDVQELFSIHSNTTGVYLASVCLQPFGIQVLTKIQRVRRFPSFFQASLYKKANLITNLLQTRPFSVTNQNNNPLLVR